MPMAQEYALHPQRPFMQSATHSQLSILWKATTDQSVWLHTKEESHQISHPENGWE